jgi:carbamoyl-phosphate synthase large subunit
VVLPFLKFAGVLPVLGPEMRSTGESMGIDADPYLAYYKALAGANVHLPERAAACAASASPPTTALPAVRALGFEVVTTRRRRSTRSPATRC